MLFPRISVAGIGRFLAFEPFCLYFAPDIFRLSTVTQNENITEPGASVFDYTVHNTVYGNEILQASEIQY